MFRSLGPCLEIFSSGYLSWIMLWIISAYFTFSLMNWVRNSGSVHGLFTPPSPVRAGPGSILK